MMFVMTPAGPAAVVRCGRTEMICGVVEHTMCTSSARSYLISVQLEQSNGMVQDHVQFTWTSASVTRHVPDSDLMRM